MRSAAAVQVAADVDRDAIEPRHEVVIELEPAEVFVEAQVNFLGGVLGIFDVAQEPGVRCGRLDVRAAG